MEQKKRKQVSKSAEEYYQRLEAKYSKLLNMKEDLWVSSSQRCMSEKEIQNIMCAIGEYVQLIMYKCNDASLIYYEFKKFLMAYMFTAYATGGMYKEIAEWDKSFNNLSKMYKELIERYNALDANYRKIIRGIEGEYRNIVKHHCDMFKQINEIALDDLQNSIAQGVQFVNEKGIEIDDI